MASFVAYSADGSTDEFTIPFSYISRSDVVVQISGVSVDFEFINDSQIKLTTVPDSGVTILIRRFTPREPLVDFTDGSTLFESDLDLLAVQTSYLVQEAIDIADNSISKTSNGGAFDAKGLRIRNVGDPIDDADLVTKGFVNNSADSVLSQAKQIRNELYGLTTSMVKLPFGSEGYAQYDATSGNLTFYLSEGPQGPQGATGPTGNTGPQGPIGTEGPRGPQGPVGPSGDTGPSGPQGIQGPSGLQGPKGDTGDRGPQGPQGNIGLIGATGSQGPQGDTGPQGPEGPQGAQGPQGPQGLTGETGPIGPVGLQGPLGPQGPQGIQGPVGPDGAKGPIGDMGATPLGLAFGTFSIDIDGELLIEYYGDANDNDFSIDADGFLYVTTV